MKKIFLVIALLCVSLQARDLYEALKGNVIPLNDKNFGKQLSQSRKDGVATIHFYDSSDGFSEGFTADYQQFALDYKNIFRVLAVNCGSYPDICDKEKIEETPVLRVYPQVPIPSFDIEEKTTKRLARKCARFV